MYFLDILYFTRNLPGFDNCGKVFTVQFCKFWRDDKLATGEGYHNISLSAEDYVIFPGFSRILVVNMCLGIGYSDCAFARLRILCSII